MSQSEMPQAREYKPNTFHPDTNWSIVYHRIIYGKENNKPCQCDTCSEYFQAIADKKIGA